MSSSSKPNLGRRKVNIQKIENDRNLQVTFSKRRVGLFKKASELCTLTGTEAGIVVFSPGNKPHSFGHPNIDAISERFLQQQQRSSNNIPAAVLVNNPRSGDVEYLAELERRIEGEKARREDLKKWAPSAAALGRLSHQQLAVLRGRIAEFGKALEATAAKRNEDGTELGLGMPYGDDGSMPIPYDDVAIGDGEEACVVFYRSQG